MEQSLTTFHESILTESQVSSIFELFKANTVRLRSPFSMVFVTIYDEQALKDSREIEKLAAYLQSKTRKTDVMFSLTHHFGWGIILAHGSEKEANAFIQRVFSDVKSERSEHLALVATIAVIANDDVSFKAIIAEGVQALNEAKNINPWHVHYITKYKQKKMETIKVSIIEPNKIVQNIIEMALERFKERDYELDIKTFYDGFEFIESRWYNSSHRHFIIMNDILPRKNGFEVLNFLRSLPNDKRFIIFMMSMKNSENDTIVAFENGVDYYLVQPFDIRLFEAKIKRAMERLT